MVEQYLDHMLVATEPSNQSAKGLNATEVRASSLPSDLIHNSTLTDMEDD